MKNQVEENVFSAVEPLLLEIGYELVDVEYRDLENGMNLTIFIHKEGGITMDDCQIVAKLLDEPLDKLNPTNNEHYYFNVSSVGIDRPIKTIKDYLRNIGKEIDVVYTSDDKEKKLQGILKELSDDTIIINSKGKLTTIELKNIISATQTIKF
ncbi:MAG: ribosome maturation factor RimP [Tenericutes bacterium HGW-Tenericutes-4]|nr:MAG: ribosome maturation factor RimP [Tenericutes bacterium HGW-Tenericutes-4]